MDERNSGSEHTVVDWSQGLEPRGDASASELFTALYAELRRLAGALLRRRGGTITLGATTLVHEAYLSMVGRREISFAERARFFSYASRAMRGLVIDYCRQRQALKRGRQFEITLDEDTLRSADVTAASADLSELNEALQGLASLDATLAELVDLHFFAGLSFVEIASLRQASVRTVQRDWKKARLLLHAALRRRVDSKGRALVSSRGSPP